MLLVELIKPVSLFISDKTQVLSLALDRLGSLTCVECDWLNKSEVTSLHELVIFILFIDDNDFIVLSSSCS